MTDSKLRAWWSHKQGLDGGLEGKNASEVLSAAGWARSVAGAGPYLTLFSRAGLRRAAIDDAVARAEIHELPAARGCTYVLPAADYALGLTVGQAFTDGDMKVARKLGVTDDEIAALRVAVKAALLNGPLEPDALRTAVGAAARNLGPEGVKKGITTTVPLALGAMQSAGEIRRIPVNGRLDQQRYKYTLWKPNPLAHASLSQDASFTELARHFFRWTGCASLPEFQWFSGLSGKAAKAAVEPLRLAALGDRLMLPEDREVFEHFQPPTDPQYTLVSSLDGISALRRNAMSLMTAEDQTRVFVALKTSVVDLPNHGIMDRGRLAGLWEYDTATESIAWTAFVKPDKALRAAVAKTEAFIREDLGDARSFSLDSPKSRVSKIEALRKGAVA